MQKGIKFFQISLERSDHMGQFFTKIALGSSFKNVIQCMIRSSHTMFFCLFLQRKNQKSKIFIIAIIGWGLNALETL